MKNTGKRLILISFILAVVSIVVIVMYLKPIKTTSKVVVEKTILVAAETIPERTLIDKKMVKEMRVPESEIFKYYIGDSSNIIGKYTKDIILKDEGFHKDKLINSLDNELSLKIEGNNRGVSINVNGSTGVSDLVKQGDFVDVIVFLSEKKDGQKIIRPDLSTLLLQNIQVLAIDKELTRYGEKRIEVPSSYLVTLSVPIFDIEKLTLAEDIGKLKLVLRPLKPDYIHKTEGATWEQLILNDAKETAGVNYKKYAYYKVKQGDTLRKISEDFYGDPSKYALLKQVNGIWNENLIKTGTGIKIPVLEK